MVVCGLYIAFNDIFVRVIFSVVVCGMKITPVWWAGLAIELGCSGFFLALLVATTSSMLGGGVYEDERFYSYLPVL